MIFPDFENIDAIDRIRTQYDPLCNYVRPHITLVFPFKSDITSCELNKHIKTALLNCNPFQLTMQGFTASVEPCSTYLFLNATNGLQQLYQLSRSLYTGILDKYQSDIYRERYCPHLTVGNLDPKEDYMAILDDLGKEITEFTTLVDHVSVEILGDESSSLELSVPLYQTL